MILCLEFVRLKRGLLNWINEFLFLGGGARRLQRGQGDGSGRRGESLGQKPKYLIGDHPLNKKSIKERGGDRSYMTIAPTMHC